MTTQEQKDRKVERAQAKVTAAEARVTKVEARRRALREAFEAQDTALGVKIGEAKAAEREARGVLDWTQRMPVQGELLSAESDADPTGEHELATFGGPSETHATEPWGEDDNLIASGN